MRAPSLLLALTLLTPLALHPARASAPAVPAASPEWAETLEAAVPAVLSLRLNQTRAFDQEGASSSVATGFVVDAEAGLILTNRHVVSTGPVTAEGVFINNEEVALEAVYRDPVHDFGFFRFDPEAVRYLDLVALPLAPEAARVGVEVRVVGNDAGEKISILQGTLARLDRGAPSYGKGRYNDFNTFYIQAASGTSGGSSGSPVLDRQGRVVALNAGGRNSSAQSFYLPLDRVVRALERIRAGEAVSRGGLQVVFEHQTWDEVARFGLPEDEEATVRETDPEATGLLVVREILPGGPADGRLQTGDVLRRVEGAEILDFVSLEALLDERVGEAVAVEVFRGGEALELQVEVSDLHALQPREYLAFGGGIVHPVSHQQARAYAVPVEGVVVATGGYALGSAGISAGDVITEVAGRPVASLDELETALAAQPDGVRVPLRTHDLRDPRTSRVSLVDIDRRWFTMERCRRDDATGTWPCTASPEAPAAPPRGPASTSLLLPEDRVARKVAPSLVMVEFDIPYRVEGVHGTHFRGTGVVVDAERGWVLVDRDTVPLALGDVTVTIGASLQVPAEVLWLHPVHNLAFVRYDPALVGDTPVRSVRLAAGEPPAPGHRVVQVGLTGESRVVSRSTRISRVDPLYLGVSRPPAFRDQNLEVLDPEEVSRSTGGLLADRQGRMVALWASYVDPAGGAQGTFEGLPAGIVAEALERLRSEGSGLAWPELGAELFAISHAEAREQGVPDGDLAALATADPSRRQVLAVRRVTRGSPAEEVLRSGDLLLAVDGRPVTRFRDVELGVDGPEPVPLRLVRGGEVREEYVTPELLSGEGIDRAVSWAGALLHAPHRPLASQHGLEREGVYVAWAWYGSPASRDKLRATRRIIEVDGRPTPDLDAFLAAVADKQSGEAVRLRTRDLDDRELSLTLRLDLDYWPTVEIRRDPEGWQARPLP